MCAPAVSRRRFVDGGKTMIEAAAGLRKGIEKCPTGIKGLDAITYGGLPRGRATLVCGGPGCGKTLLAMEFLLRGALESGEPGVFMAFEEDAAELRDNVASLGFDLDALAQARKFVVDTVRIDRSQIEEAGAYDLDGLFVRLEAAIDAIGAKRVVLDTLEVLFAALSDAALLRAEVRRLFEWLKGKGVTTIATAERSGDNLSRFGLEEYIADCVILLSNRIEGQLATRRLRIVKYRGSLHGSGEFPFLIDSTGMSLLPLTALGLAHAASTERVSSGVPALDAMLDGHSFFRGSSVLVSGTAGAGKSSLAAHFVDAGRRRGERCLWFAYEESPGQIMRNMRSIGIDLETAQRDGLLRFHAERPTFCGLEMHLLAAHKGVAEFRPQLVVVDPITGFGALGAPNEVKATLIALIDLFKTHGITAFFTSLTAGGAPLEATDAGIASLMDVWLLLRDLEVGAERNRILHVLKARGVANSNQIREFVLTEHGIEIREACTGPSGELQTGSMRALRERRERDIAYADMQAMAARQRLAERRHAAAQAHIAAQQAELAVQQAEAEMAGARAGPAAYGRPAASGTTRSST